MSLEQQNNESKSIWRSEPYGGRYIDLSSGDDGRLTFSVVAVGASHGDALGSICPHEFTAMTKAVLVNYFEACQSAMEAR